MKAVLIILALVIASAITAHASAFNASCTACSTRVEPPPACCDVTTQFCCGIRLCCNVGQVCGDGMCITVTPVPPLPPGPPSTGELLWANLIPIANPVQPLIFDAEDATQSPTLVVAAVNISGYDLHTGATRWVSPLPIDQLVQYLVPHRSSSANRFNIIAFVAAPRALAIASVSAVDGSVNWVYNLTTYLQCSQLLVAQGVVLVGRSTSLVGLDAETGEELWQQPNNQGGECFLASNPPRFVVMDTNSTLTVFMPRTGEIVWRLPNLNISQSNGVYLADSTIVTSYDYIGNGIVTAYSLSTGEVAWTWPISSEGQTPVVFGNTLFYIQTDSLNTQTVYAIDATTGATTWTWTVDYNQCGLFPTVAFGFRMPGASGSLSPVAILSDGYFIYGVQDGNLLYNITTLGETGELVPVSRSHGTLYVSVYSPTIGYAGAAVDERTGEVLWQRGAQGWVNAIAAQTVTGTKVDVAAVTGDDQYIYGVATP